MKIVKIANHYFLLEQQTINEGNYYWDGESVHKMVMNVSSSKNGWVILGTTDPTFSSLPHIEMEQIEKPAPTEFTSKDMIKYSNWILQWCSDNRYRKTLAGVQSSTGDNIYTDEEIFNTYLAFINPIKDEWNHVEATINGNLVLITKLQ